MQFANVSCCFCCPVCRPYVQLIEDCAESFSGFEYLGHPSSDLTLISFGSIKVATGFGCGLGRVRDRATAEAMQREQDGWEPQGRSAFFTKCVKNTFAMAVLNVPLISNGVMQGARAAGYDHKALVVSSLRGFPGDQLMGRLRAQPSVAMLEMLRRKLLSFDPAAFQAHQDACDLMLELLPASVSAPGLDAPIRNHWLFPVLVDDIDAVLKELNDAGVDAYKGATQLALVPKPQEVQEHTPPTVSAGEGKRGVLTCGG